MNAFDRLNNWIRDTESSIVNIVSAIAPWLAPLAPAYMTYQHARTTLGFPEWVAIPGAVTVEILGFSTVSTYLAFWFHNRKNAAEAKKAPLGIVVFAFIFYLSLIIVSNVILDASGGAKWAVIVVRAMFTLQSIPAALIVAVRTQHRDMLHALTAEKESKRKVTESFPKAESLGIAVTDWRKLRPQLTAEQVNAIAQENPKDIGFLYNVSERTARNWRNYAKQEKSK
jgi:hypothetical protein